MVSIAEIVKGVEVYSDSDVFFRKPHFAPHRTNHSDDFVDPEKLHSALFEELLVNSFIQKYLFLIKGKI